MRRQTLVFGAILPFTVVVLCCMYGEAEDRVRSFHGDITVHKDNSITMRFEKQCGFSVTL